jgi:hypothetical protein
MNADFSVGQVWKYRTRPHEGESEITIVALDSDGELGNIVHIYVADVDIPNPKAPDGKTVFIGHLPYSEEALRGSVTELVATADSLPDFEAGYELWKKAFDAGEAGVFEVAVSEAIDGVQQNVA